MDFIKINKLADLQAEIRVAKANVKLRETELEGRWKKLPAETFKSSIGAVLPAFLSNRISGKSWLIVRSIIGLVTGNALRSKISGKQTIFSSVKQLGLLAAARGIYNYWKHKPEKK